MLPSSENRSMLYHNTIWPPPLELVHMEVHPWPNKMGLKNQGTIENVLGNILEPVGNILGTWGGTLWEYIGNEPKKQRKKKNPPHGLILPLETGGTYLWACCGVKLVMIMDEWNLPLSTLDPNSWARSYNALSLVMKEEEGPWIRLLINFMWKLLIIRSSRLENLS
jgi:hypothetical protein